MMNNFYISVLNTSGKEVERQVVKTEHSVITGGDNSALAKVLRDHAPIFVSGIEKNFTVEVFVADQSGRPTGEAIGKASVSQVLLGMMFERIPA